MAVSNIVFDYSYMIASVSLATFLLGFGHSTLGCRVVTRIHLHEDGKNLDLTLRYFNLIDHTHEVPIAEFRNNYASLLMFMWNLHPIPKNIISGIESPIEELLPMYAKHSYGFYMLHGKPKEVKEEILFNVLNGVQINTKNFKPRVNFFRERYKVLDPPQ